VRCSELDTPYTAEDRARDAHGEEGPITLLHVLEQSILRVMAPPNFLDSCLVSQVRENACFGCKCPAGPKGTANLVGGLPPWAAVCRKQDSTTRKPFCSFLDPRVVKKTAPCWGRLGGVRSLRIRMTEVIPRMD
jgi:hypothetical protein